MDTLDIHAFLKHMLTLSLTEVEPYSTFDMVMRLKYATKSFLTSTLECYVFGMQIYMHMYIQ